MNEINDIDKFYGIDIYKSYNELEKQCKTLIINGFDTIQSKARSLQFVEKVVVMDSYIGSNSFGETEIKEYLFLNTNFSKFAFKTEDEYVKRNLKFASKFIGYKGE